jgi:hypothetical protein
MSRPILNYYYSIRVEKPKKTIKILIGEVSLQIKIRIGETPNMNEY